MNSKNILLLISILVLSVFSQCLCGATCDCTDTTSRTCPCNTQNPTTNNYPNNYPNNHALSGDLTGLKHMGTTLGTPVPDTPANTDVNLA